MMKELKKEGREDIKESWQGDYPRHAVEKIVLEYIDKATLAQKKKDAEIVKQAKETIWQPVGGISNIKWISKETTIKAILNQQDD